MNVLRGNRGMGKYRKLKWEQGECGESENRGKGESGKVDDRGDLNRMIRDLQ